MTKKRLWTLYCNHRCTLQDICQLTGWTKSQILSGIRRWDLSDGSTNWLQTDRWITNRIAERLGVRVTLDLDQDFDRLKREIVEEERAKMLARGVNWDAVDAGPWPDDVRLGWNIARARYGVSDAS